MPIPAFFCMHIKSLRVTKITYHMSHFNGKIVVYCIESRFPCKQLFSLEFEVETLG
jgi:hypothetical protein